MNSTAAGFFRLGMALSGLMVLGWVLTGQAANLADEGLPTDWSHRHLIFSQPATAAQVKRVAHDPRYWQQWYRQNLTRGVSEGEATSGDAAPLEVGSLVRDRYRRMHRDWSEDLGSGGTAGADNFPAKYSFSLTTANCADYVAFSTGLQSSSTQASIVAYDNLYSGGCTAPVPSTYWAYNTTVGSFAGTIKTSPVPSRDGSQIAFVQTDGLHGTLILLKWAANTGTAGSPVKPTLITVPSSYPGCSAPCMIAFPLRTALNVQTNDTTSSVYYDYSGDTAWVGDSRELLHKFHPFFNGTPAEVTTAPWPVQVNSNVTALSSPVYDQGSGNVFIGDAGGFVERVVATTGVATVSGQVDHGTGVVEGPTVDSTAGLVYVFASDDGTTNCAGPCAAVYLFGTNFGSGTTGSEIAVGASSASPNPLYGGDFDSTYENSANATGNLYVCGNTGGIPTLYQVPIKSGVMSTAVTGPALASATTACSPVTDVANPNAAGGASEWIFASAQASGVGSCTSTGCIINFKDTPWIASHAYTAGQEVLDSNFQIQVVNTAGTSGATTPTWSTTIGGATIDGGVTWYDQGPYSASPAAWTAGTNYVVGNEVVDTNNNVERCNHAGTSNATAPAWKTALGASTNETGGGPHWINEGPVASNGLKAAGGTSGIVIDNIVGSGTLLGASQVYYSTLSDQACVTSGGTGGCAVQASQAALQ